MSKQTEWNKLVGRTVLVSPRDHHVRSYLEYKVLGVSPSGTKVNMENKANRTFWCDSDEYVVQEVLDV